MLAGAPSIAPEAPLAPRAHALWAERERIATWIGLVLLLAVQSFALARQRAPYLEDDGAFFLRYAENIAAGNGYRWNPGEAPVWGASAPLWPLFLAAGIEAGLTPAQSSLVWSVGFALAASLVLGLAARRVFGVVGLFALTPLLALNFLYSTWATSGLESPLTFLLVALAVWKRDRSVRALVTAGAIAGLGYGLLAWYFGTPVPNSFLRKLSTSYGNIPRTWFAQMALIAGAGWLRSSLAVAGAFALRRRPEVATVALAAVLVPTVAYTLKPPSEGFLWYPAAISGAVAFLAAGGIAFLVERVPARSWGWLRPVAASAALIALALFLEREEMPRVRGWQRFLASSIPTMRAGGEWVDEHLPADARVMTGWGHPAHASRRFVYDSSFLNRRPEDGNLREKYQPEAIIQLVQVPLEEHPVPRNYRRAKVFVPPEGSHLAFTAVAVFVREDVPVDGVAAKPPLSDPVAPVAPVAQEPLLPEGWARALTRQLLAGASDEVPDPDPRLLRRLSELIAQRRELSDPPESLALLEQRIRDVEAGR